LNCEIGAAINYQVIRFRYFFRASLILLCGTALGLLIGWLVFSISSLSGKSLFLAEGALIGLVISAIAVAFNRGSGFLTLSEMTLNLPQFGEMKFAINLEYRRVAWKLFVETLTRVSTQPLGTEDGSLREALTSIYSLFNATRELLKNMPPSKPASRVTVEMLAVRMLNQEIRPFLSKWHVRLKKFEATRGLGIEESEWSQNEECRKDLEALRSRLMSYAKAFGELASVANLSEFLSA
jgi:hypothetical protein